MTPAVRSARRTRDPMTVPMMTASLLRWEWLDTKEARGFEEGGRDEVGRGGVDEAVRSSELAAVGVNVGKTVVVTVVVADKGSGTTFALLLVPMLIFRELPVTAVRT